MFSVFSIFKLFGVHSYCFIVYAEIMTHCIGQMNSNNKRLFGISGIFCCANFAALNPPHAKSIAFLQSPVEPNPPAGWMLLYDPQNGHIEISTVSLCHLDLCGSVWKSPQYEGSLFFNGIVVICTTCIVYQFVDFFSVSNRRTNIFFLFLVHEIPRSTNTSASASGEPATQPVTIQTFFSLPVRKQSGR